MIDRFYNNYVSCFLTGGSTSLFLSFLSWASIVTCWCPHANLHTGEPSPTSPYLKDLGNDNPRSTDIKFLLLHAPNPTLSTPYYSSGGGAGSSAASLATTTTTTATATSTTTMNPTAPATEEAIRQFFMDVYDVWVKNIMNPFYIVNMEVKSPVFRARVVAAARKYL